MKYYCESNYQWCHSDPSRSKSRGNVFSIRKALGLLAALCLVTPRLWAGGSGLNVLVVVNQASSNSAQLGNYYCEQRQVPPQNYLRIYWTNSTITWAVSDFTNVLLNPLLAMLAANQLTNQIDYVVLSMDIPYHVTAPGSAAQNSTTSSLFYGFKFDPNPPCSLAPGSDSLYAGSESIFRLTPPISPASNSFLTLMITGTNLAGAKMVVDQGVVSDGTFPTQTVYLAKSTDAARNVRFYLFDNAIFNTRLRGNYSMVRTNLDAVADMGPLLGCQSGLYNFVVTGDDFAPGSMADNLDSFGGLILEPNGELNVLSFLQAGAVGTYGTVDEPCNYLQKFPIPQDYFWQARGFSLAECYYMSVTNPYQGLTLGEPLAAPFAQPGVGAWLIPGANALLSGTTNLTVQFAASDALHPLQQLDLFIDGTLAQTLTNIAPAAGNKLYITINGYTTNYTVPTGATILSVVSNLVSTLNDSTYSNATLASAIAFGDRVELHSMNLTKPGSQVSLSVSNSPGTGSALTTFAAASRAGFLDTVAYGIQSYEIENTATNVPVGDYLQLSVTKTNGTVVNVAVTNTVSGTSFDTLVAALVNAINTNALLQTPDGLTAQDYTDIGAPVYTFDLLPNTPGWNAAEIQATLTASAIFAFFPVGQQTLEANLGDLQPRNHLYITAGATNLAMTFAFNTTTQANGFHELTAVAYEGSHVRTQTRATQRVQIQNRTLSATLTTLYGGSNTLVSATLQFSVAANASGLIQLFSTGGLLASATNQSSAVFSIPGTNLDLGLHPIYAVVTTPDGQQYRTQTQWIRLIDTPDAPFRLSIAYPPPTLSWPATAGRTYDILSATNPRSPFQFIAVLTASNSPAQWVDTNRPAHQKYYHVQSAD